MADRLVILFPKTMMLSQMDKACFTVLATLLTDWLATDCTPHMTHTMFSNVEPQCLTPKAPLLASTHLKLWVPGSSGSHHLVPSEEPAVGVVFHVPYMQRLEKPLKAPALSKGSVPLTTT